MSHDPHLTGFFKSRAVRFFPGPGKGSRKLHRQLAAGALVLMQVFAVPAPAMASTPTHTSQQAAPQLPALPAALAGKAAETHFVGEKCAAYADTAAQKASPQAQAEKRRSAFLTCANSLLRPQNGGALEDVLIFIASSLLVCGAGALVALANFVIQDRATDPMISRRREERLEKAREQRLASRSGRQPGELPPGPTPFS